jgi:hypothetical protein
MRNSQQREIDQSNSKKAGKDQAESDWRLGEARLQDENREREQL